MENVNQIAQKMITWMEGTENFVSDQAPDVVNQLILYARINHTLWIFLSAAIVFACYKIFKYCLKNIGQNIKFKEETLYDIIMTISAILGIIFLIFAGNSIESSLQAWFMPKVYVLEYFKDFMN